MFKFAKKLFSNKGEVKTSNESVYRTDAKYDGSIHRGMFFIDGNIFEGAYIRDGHKSYYTFVTSQGLCHIERSREFKMIKRVSMLDLNTEAVIANVIDGKAVRFNTI